METSISLRVQKSAKLLADVIATLMSHKFRVRNYRFTEVEANGQQRMILSISGGAIGLSELAGKLASITGTLEVEDNGELTARPDAEVSKKLPAEAISIAAAYPDIVGPVHRFEDSIEEKFRSQLLPELGEKVGAQVLANEFSDLRSGGSIEKAMKKLVLRAVSPFAMANVAGKALHVSICPFCHSRESKTLDCGFLAGFVAGLINAGGGIPNKKRVKVVETSCKARGEASCTFEVS